MTNIWVSKQWNRVRWVRVDTATVSSFLHPHNNNEGRNEWLIPTPPCCFVHDGIRVGCLCWSCLHFDQLVCDFGWINTHFFLSQFRFAQHCHCFSGETGWIASVCVWLSCVSCWPWQKVPSFCLYFIHHTHSLVSSCLLLTETKKKPKSKSPPSSERTTYVPVTAEHDTVDLLDQDFSDEEEEDQAGFAQGHSQSGKVARKEPRVPVQQARKESGKEQAARIRREEREEALKQQQLALNQENLARKRKFNKEK